MAYDKTTWASGDVITADKLNHIEDGIEGVVADQEAGTQAKKSLHLGFYLDANGDLCYDD